MVTIRPFSEADAEALWSILRPAFRAGDTYTIDPEIPRDDALAYWTGTRPEDASREVWMASDGDAVLGTYYIRANQGGGGNHVCNCGYVTHPEARGRGVARAMLAHSLDRAPELGYRAMQYNFVVASNRRAIDTWTRAGFETVGRLPRAFRHPTEGLTDALVMFKEF